MGYSEWSDSAYRGISGTRTAASSAEIFRSDKSIDPLMNPRGMRAREARDSEHHPLSVPIIVAFDVTGSMGDVPTKFAKDLLGRLMTRLVEERWVTDPQILFAAIGDAVSDRAPLQVGQFESGLEMDMWLTRLWIEGGGGDFPESYTLAHWFAAHHTATDAWQERGAKGFLFTIGDATNKPLQNSHVHRVFGQAPEWPTDDASVIAAAAERYELFHITLTRGQAIDPSVEENWRALVGDRLLVLDNVDAICELMGVAMAAVGSHIERDAAGAALTAAGMTANGVESVLERLF